MAELTTPDNAVSFFLGFPRRVGDIAEVMETPSDLTDGVNQLSDHADGAIERCHEAGYAPDSDIAEAASVTGLSGAGDRLRTACTQAARCIAGIPSWEDRGELLASIDETVKAMGAEVRSLQRQHAPDL